MAKVFVPKETHPGETRVAATPDTVKRFIKAGLEVVVEEGAGLRARFPDALYAAAGARIEGPDAAGDADLYVAVQPPEVEQLRKLKKDAIVVATILPSANPDCVKALAQGELTSLSMDLIPRITRAQSMDVLSSQATVAGYKAVLLGASHLGKLCPLLMTAAGTVPPAKVVIFGAGVAGLQAIATAKRLGCKVEATDIRLAAKEQVESLGARFIDVPGAEDMEDERGYAKQASEEFLQRQREEVAKRVAEADLVITTAQIPGRKAPVLVSEEMVKSMPEGAVVVDLAVDSGGNCALSEPGQVVEKHGVVLVGISNLPATVPQHASELYAKNVLNLSQLFITKEGKLELDLEDEVLAGCLLTREGQVVHAQTREALEAAGA